jgi:hypothetical protein
VLPADRNLSLIGSGLDLPALMLHFVGQGLEQSAFTSPRWSQQQGHAARQYGPADVVQNDEPVLARADT